MSKNRAKRVLRNPNLNPNSNGGCADTKDGEVVIRKGPVPHQQYNETDTVCRCMSIRRVEAAQFIKCNRKTITFDELVSCSGAGSICSGCHPLLREMLGEELWTYVDVVSVKSNSPDINTYRFSAIAGQLSPAKAGQHILVQAHINGRWEMRRYTLVTSAEEVGYREIAVKRTPDGVVSNWLHQAQKPQQSIRISQPFGDTTPDLTSASPLVCLVAGVGITPAISFIRSMKQSKVSRELVLDYSVSTKHDLIYADEIKSIADKKNNIRVNFRLTNEVGYIKKHHVVKMVSSNPESEYFICGPRNYARALVGYLEEAGVRPDKISQESFSVSEQAHVQRSNVEYYLGLTLFTLFVLQCALNVKFPWLERLQLNETFKVYSGLLVLLYLFSQFVMPYNNASKARRLSVKHYQRHKFYGCLAPLLFYLHSTGVGTAYLLLLSAVFFSNFLVGIFNHERINSAKKRLAYFKVWLPVHIVLSVLLLGLIGFHVYVVASY